MWCDITSHRNIPQYVREVKISFIGGIFPSRGTSQPSVFVTSNIIFLNTKFKPFLKRELSYGLEWLIFSNGPQFETLKEIGGAPFQNGHVRDRYKDDETWVLHGISGPKVCLLHSTNIRWGPEILEMPMVSNGTNRLAYLMVFPVRLAYLRSY